MNGNLFLSAISKENADLTFLKINKPSQKKIERYLTKLEHFHKNKDSVDNTKEQGDLLEKLVEEILRSINCLEYITNERTNGNEMDILVKLNEAGIILRAAKLIPDWFPDFFVVECKNYTNQIGIPAINKFHSLLESHSINFGLFVYFKSISGENKKGWQDAMGLVSKLAFQHSVLLKYNYKHPTPIILNISYETICSLKEMNYNFFDWIKTIRFKLIADVSSNFISGETHENNNKFKDKIL